MSRKRITPQEAAAIVPATPAATRSELEDAVLDLIEQAGLPTPQVNQPLPNGLVPDFRWPDHHLILEADGAAYHDHPLAREDDARRQAQLETQGERVLRLSYTQVFDDPGEAIERLTRALTGSPGTDPAPTA